MRLFFFSHNLLVANDSFTRLDVKSTLLQRLNFLMERLFLRNVGRRRSARRHLEGRCRVQIKIAEILLTHCHQIHICVKMCVTDIGQ